MIINAEQGSVELRGDITEFKTGIDPKNLEFITTLLSSNLYSAPEQSFIREIVSNAWDSHVEAGNTDTPVIVKYDMQKRSITIRDFGTGLSPERFKEVYCNIGSSTKRESNDFIGGFGIGKYSSLAVSDTVYITSFYEGIAYYYIMVKSGNNITTNLVAELPTKEKNGVEVTVKEIDNFYPYQHALDYIIFFPNVYVEAPDYIASVVNKVKIKKFKNFWVSSEVTRHRLLLGNVLYPLNEDLLRKEGEEVRSILSKARDTGVVFKFEVGEIGVTPNRESIIYTPETIKIIKQRILDAGKEITGIIKGCLSEDFDDIFKYYEVLDSTIRYDFIKGEINRAKNRYDLYGFQFKEIPDCGFTYKGENHNNPIFLGVMRAVNGSKIPTLRCVLYDEKFHTQRFPYGSWDYQMMDSSKKIAIKESQRLTAVAKSWLKESYNSASILNIPDKGKFIEALRKDLSYRYLEDEKTDYYLDEVYECFMNTTTIIDFETDANFLKYKEDAKNNKVKVPTIKNVILNVYSRPTDTCIFQRKNVMKFNTLEDAIENIKARKKGVVIEGISPTDNFFADIACARGFVYITCNKEVLKALDDIEFTCRVSKAWLLKDDRILKKMHTIRASNVLFDTTIIDSIPSPLQEELLCLQAFDRKYRDWNAYLSHSFNKDIEEDAYTKYLCDQYNSYKGKWDSACAIVKEDGRVYVERDLQFTTAVVMKKKLYRVSSSYYHRMKDNNLIKVLCRK